MPIGDAVDGISSLQARYRADQITGLTNGAGISSWPDSTGSFNASQATGTAQPTFQTGVVNGQSVARWPSGATHSMTSSAVTTSASQTIVAVVNPSTVNALHAIVGSSTNGLEYRINTTAKLEILHQNTASVATSTTSVVASTWQVLVMTYATSGAYQFFIDGTAAGSGTASTTFTASTLIIGEQQAPGSDFMVGDIAELIMWTKILSSAERVTVDSYCQDRYGISVSDYVPAAGPTLTLQPLRNQARFQASNW